MEASGVLTALRLASGETQGSLAAKLDITQGALSKWESGALSLEPERIAQLAAFFGVSTDLFSSPRSQEVRVFHRKRSSLPISEDKRLRAHASILRAQYLSLLGPRPVALKRHALPEDGYYDAADMARQVRDDLKISDGPIDSLVEVFERAGVLIHAADLRSVKIDSMATWAPGDAPFILLNDRAPGDRQRFSLAHEIGHAVMHDLPNQRQEIEADAFASEFLMPAATIRSELRNPSLESLLRLKSRWKVSAAALGRRARDLGQMTERDYRNFNVEMTRAGMHRSEPAQIPAERPQLIKAAIEERLHDGQSISDIAAAAWMTEERFRHEFGMAV